MSRKKGGRGLASIEDCIDATIQGFEEYTEKSIEKLIAPASNSNIIRYNLEQTGKQQNQIWEEKHLYSYFKQQTKEIVQVRN